MVSKLIKNKHKTHETTTAVPINLPVSTTSTNNEHTVSVISPKAVIDHAAVLLNTGSPSTPPTGLESTVVSPVSSFSTSVSRSSSTTATLRPTNSSIARSAALSNTTTNTIEYHQIDSSLNITSNINILYSGIDGKEEVGEGLGPTIEFYSLICQHILRKDLDLWITTGKNSMVTNDTTTNINISGSISQSNIELISAPYGLHPLPVYINPLQNHSYNHSNTHNTSTLHSFPIHHTTKSAFVTHHFEFLGRFVSKALQEHRLLDLPLSKPFIKAIMLGPSITTNSCVHCNHNNDIGNTNWKDIHFTIDDIMQIDPSLGQSLTKLENDVLQRDTLINSIHKVLQFMQNLKSKINSSSQTAKINFHQYQEEYNQYEEKLYEHIKELSILWNNYDMAMLTYQLPINHSTNFPLTWLPPHPDYVAHEYNMKNHSSNNELASFLTSIYTKWEHNPPVSSNNPVSNSNLQGIFTMIYNKDLFSNNNNTNMKELREWLIPSTPISYYDVQNNHYHPTVVSLPLVKSTNSIDIPVTLANLHLFIASVIQTVCIDGISLQRDAFLRGMGVYCPSSCIISPCLSSSSSTSTALHYSSSLRLFTIDEFYDILTSTSTIHDNNLWTTSAIESSIILGNHYNKGSPPIRWFIQALSSLTIQQRKLFLKFLTGTPTLPKGGFMSLVPRMTIQKSIINSNQHTDEILPTASTCHIYLKLPSYSSYDILYAKLIQAIEEGHENFDKT